MVAVRFTRGETNFLRVDLGASRSGSLPATGATSEPVIRTPTVANIQAILAISGIASFKRPPT